jgi:hypothetical protein
MGLGSVFGKRRELAAPEGAGMGGDTLVPEEELDGGGGQARVDLLADKRVGGAL